jgi:hypothetical protein
MVWLCLYDFIHEIKQGVKTAYNQQYIPLYFIAATPQPVIQRKKNNRRHDNDCQYMRHIKGFHYHGE